MPEGDVVAALNTWIGELFRRENVDRTEAALLASQAGERGSADHEVLKKRAADAETVLKRNQAAVAVTDAEIHAMIDSLGDVGAKLTEADLGALNQLYGELGVGLLDEPKGRTVIATVSPRVVSACPRGTRARVRGIRAWDACSCYGP
ncbi:hypothetical protein [Amycolatopsis sp. 3B14]|uniref:hypothetical protein n=1 Tax=Amycolatopsis sp. 3B14 TaxID=3243600 RepID=UPI003D964FEA